jgi:hypothetical protein
VCFFGGGGAVGLVRMCHGCACPGCALLCTTVHCVCRVQTDTVAWGNPPPPRKKPASGHAAAPPQHPCAGTSAPHRPGCVRGGRSAARAPARGGSGTRGSARARGAQTRGRSTPPGVGGARAWARAGAWASACGCAGHMQHLLGVQGHGVRCVHASVQGMRSWQTPGDAGTHSRRRRAPSPRAHLDVALAQRVVDHVFVLLCQQRARGVHHVAAAGAVGVDEVDGRQQQLLLQVRAAPDVVRCLARLLCVWRVCVFCVYIVCILCVYCVCIVCVYCVFIVCIVCVCVCVCVCVRARWRIQRCGRQHGSASRGCRTLTLGSLLTTPLPLQGASSSTRSTALRPTTPGSWRPS